MLITGTQLFWCDTGPSTLVAIFNHLNFQTIKDQLCKNIICQPNVLFFIWSLSSLKKHLTSLSVLAISKLRVSYNSRFFLYLDLTKIYIFTQS